MEGRFVSYLREQPARNRRYGLSLDAQRAAVRTRLGSGELLGEFVEEAAAQGGLPGRLQEALSLCQANGATLLLGRMGSLTRERALLGALAKSGVAFRACDLPEATDATVQVLLAVAEHERQVRSERSHLALLEAKRRGVRLGNPDGLSGAALQRGRELGTAVRRNRADAFAHRVFPRVLELQQRGLSLREVARQLDADGVATARGRGGAWTAAGVRAVLLRVGSLD